MSGEGGCNYRRYAQVLLVVLSVVAATAANENDYVTYNGYINKYIIT